MKFANKALGMDDFETLIEEKTFYVDKTDFIREWWDNKSKVTLLTRPRRFGKTLNMSTLVAGGCLKVDKHVTDGDGLNEYTLSLTNFEVKRMFEGMISEWFDESEGAYKR